LTDAADSQPQPINFALSRDGVAVLRSFVPLTFQSVLPIQRVKSFAPRTRRQAEAPGSVATGRPSPIYTYRNRICCFVKAARQVILTLPFLVSGAWSSGYTEVSGYSVFAGLRRCSGIRYAAFVNQVRPVVGGASKIARYLA
jgi:hypothetical protein